MTCKRCGREIDKNKLACAVCAEAMGWRAILDRYREFLPEIMESRSAVQIRKSAQSKIWHVKVPNYEQAWCGAKIHSAWRDKKSEYWRGLALYEVCSACLETMEQMCPSALKARA